MAFIQDYEQTVQASPTNRPQTFVNLSQNENGRQLIFHIIGVSIPAGSIATLSGTKPDGVVYSTTGTIEGDFVTVSEDMQMTAVAGFWDAKIHIVNGGNEIASALVRFVVEKDPVDAGAIPSDSQLDGIVAECQAYAEAARSSAYGSPLTAATAAAMIDQTRVYVYTGSETGYTAGHWYYYDGSAWTDGGTYNSAAIQTDPTLAIPGMAADSKAVGDAIAAEAAERAADIDDVKEDLEQLEPGLSDDAKTALLNCFQHVAWIDEHGQDYYDALEEALSEQGEKTLLSIIAVFNQGTNVVYTDDSLDTLKQYLTVTAHYDDNTDAVVTTYALSGNLAEGTSTVTVSYEGKTTTFNVVVTDFYNQWHWTMNVGKIIKIIGAVSEGSRTSVANILYSSDTNSQNTRRGFVTDRGRTSPIYAKAGGTVEAGYTDYYPIPVPDDATQVTVSVTPANQYIATYCFYAVDNLYMLTNISDISWKQGTQTIVFDNSNTNRVIVVAGKFNAGSDPYTAEPTIDVLFE